MDQTAPLAAPAGRLPIIPIRIIPDLPGMAAPGEMRPTEPMEMTGLWSLFPAEGGGRSVRSAASARLYFLTAPRLQRSAMSRAASNLFLSGSRRTTRRRAGLWRLIIRRGLSLMEAAILQRPGLQTRKFISIVLKILHCRTPAGIILS